MDEEWPKWWNACIASLKDRVQTPVTHTHIHTHTNITSKFSAWINSKPPQKQIWSSKLGMT
jgi:hypothetical protein